LDLALAPEDVPVPSGLPLAEAPPKVGRGKKVLRELRSLIPIIAKLAEGAQTQQPGFLGALGEQFSRAEEEPFRQALADQRYRKTEADIGNVWAQAGEREASTARTEGLTQEDALNAAATRDVQKWKARLDEVETGIKDVERRFAPQMTAAALKTEAAEKALKIVQEEMAQDDLKRNQWARENLDPAELEAFQALTKQRRAAAGLSDVRAKELPGQTRAAQARADALQRSEALERLQEKSNFAKLSQTMLAQREQMLQQEIKTELAAVGKLGHVDEISAENAKVYAKYKERLDDIAQRRMDVDRELQQLGQQVELLFRGGATAILPGMQTPSGVEEARDSLGIL